MNVRLLKAKRVERNLRQIDVAKALGVTEKTMNHKECSAVNKFTADEMLGLRDILGLTTEEFLVIFFDGQLTEAVKFSTERINSIREVDLRRECASTARVRQFGESPNPVKS